MIELELWKTNKMRNTVFMMFAVILSVTLLFVFWEGGVELVVVETDIPEQKTFAFGDFPYVLRQEDETKGANVNDAQAWVHRNKHIIQERLLQHGAILFRGFPLSSAEDFDKFVKSFRYKTYTYPQSSAIRTKLVGEVFTSNDAPSEKVISFHHELALLPSGWPSKVFLYCNLPAKSGGETPIAPSHEVYTDMRSKFPQYVERLAQLGLKYSKNLPAEDDRAVLFSKSWKNFFSVKTKEEAIAACATEGLDCEWFGENLVITSASPIPGVQTDARTGKKLWFNNILGALAYFNNTLPTASKRPVVYGNGEFIEQEFIDAMKDITIRNAVQFKWHAGDVLLVDNRQVLHARNSFVGPREIYVVQTEN